MIYPYGNLRYPTPYSDARVDNLSEEDGVIDQFGLLDLEIDDDKLIDNLNERIEDSRSYYNDPNGFDLEKKRAENLRMYLGAQTDTADYYDSEDPYIENQIRRAVDSIVAYATARSPQSVVTPADETPQSKKFASNLEKAHNMHSVEFDLRGIIEVMVRSWLLNQEAYVMLEYDPDYGDKGEIIPSFVPPDEVVVDKNARYGKTPPAITMFEKKTIQELLYTFPEKKEAIMRSIGFKQPGPKNVTQEVVIKRTWFTYYDAKTGRAQEAVAVHYDRVILCKYKDINWLHNGKNFLKTQMKPLIPLNVLNDGKHWIDFSTPIDDGVRLQRLINARGKQISLNAIRSNDTIVIDGKASGLKKEDAENWTRGPNQKIYLKNSKQEASNQQKIWTIPGQDVKPFVIQAQADLRNQLGEIIGVPVDQTGADISGDDSTLGQDLLKKSNDNARQDMIVRAIDRMLYNYFNLLTQLMFRWYDEEHYFPYLDSDGDFENIVIKQYYFDEGMRVNVKGLSTIAFDKNREQAMATHLIDHQGMSHLDYYRIVGFENPQKLYDNWVKETKNPYELVRDANEQYDDGNAYAEFLDIMGGKQPKMKQDASKDYVLTLRKCMFTERYLTAKTNVQKAFMDRVTRYLDMYELRTSLDQLSQMDMEKLAPGQPVPQPMSEQQFSQIQHPQMPGMPPGAPGAPPGAPPPGLPPGMPQGPPPGFPGAQPPPAPSGGMFSGTGLMNPASAQTPTGISAIPSL
jgi:hypothetical protein